MATRSGRKAAAGQRPADPKAAKKGRSYKGATEKARRRAEGLIAPNIHIVARDPLRVQILSIAISRAIAPSEFADQMDIATNVASYHFKVLREEGFLEIVKEEKIRGATKHYHRATKSGFISDADWGEVFEALQPGVAGAILQDFNGRVALAIDTKTLFRRDDACLFWKPRRLDEKGWKEHVEMIAWAIGESDRMEEETVQRLANGESSEEECMHATFAIAGFPSPSADEVKKADKKSKAAAKATAKRQPKNRR